MFPFDEPGYEPIKLTSQQHIVLNEYQKGQEKKQTKYDLAKKTRIDTGVPLTFKERWNYFIDGITLRYLRKP